MHLSTTQLQCYTESQKLKIWAQNTSQTKASASRLFEMHFVLKFLNRKTQGQQNEISDKRQHQQRGQKILAKRENPKYWAYDL